MVDTLKLVNLSSPDNVIPIDLSWKNLNCTIKSKKGDRQILKNVSGHAFHKEFLVIMGSSGAGKTTLLNILSDKLQPSSTIAVSGEVKANSQPISSITLSNYIGYVTQEDSLIESMTVFECLMFVAKLKTNYQDKAARVTELLDELKLGSCKNSRIGGAYVKGISGGEKKRTSIGMELITNPSILFLDEPTSGLDSYTAFLVCKLLLQKASEGKTVISTIHQPSSDIFYLFDKLMLMSDGRVVYSGPARESVKFIAKAGFVCPALSNPADYFMEILHVENSNELTRTELDTIDKLEGMCKSTSQDQSTLTLDLYSGSKKYATGFVYQTLLLAQRTAIRSLRNPILGIVRLSLIVVIAFMIDLFYWDLGTSGIRAISNRSGLFFFTLSCVVFCNVTTCVLTFPSMRQIMLKEYHSGLYGILPYFFSINLVDIVFDLLSTFIFVTGTYWCVGLNTNSNQVVIEYYLLTYIAFLSGGSFGMLCGTIYGKPELALASISAMLFPFMYFAGFYRSGKLPVAFKWVEYLSNFFYLFQGYMKNQFETLDIRDCEICKDELKTICKVCDPLSNFDITFSLNECLILLIGLVIFYRFVALLVMVANVRRNKL